MSISCTPADLAAAAKCFQCLPSEQKQWIDTYLLAVIAKGSTDPNTLALAAKCFQCIPSGMLRRIQAYLLCQIASGGGGGPCPQDMQVAWTPTNLKLGEELGFFTFGDIPGVTSITFSQSTSIAGFDIESTTQITSLLWPNLVTIDPTDIQNGYLAINGNSALTTVSFPVFSSTGPNSNFGITGCNALTSLSFPAMTVIGRALLFYDNTSLVSLSAPQLTTVGQFNLDAHGCTSLTTVTLTAYLPTNGVNQNFSGCALSAASVNHILARCVASAGYVSGIVNLSGGTSAAPSGQGVADKATLLGRGVTVTTN